MANDDAANALDAATVAAMPLTLCVECGPDVKVDEDGCCLSCGNGAFPSQDALTKIAARFKTPRGANPLLSWALGILVRAGKRATLTLSTVDIAELRDAVADDLDPRPLPEAPR